MNPRRALALMAMPLLAAQGAYNPRLDLDEGRYLKVLSDAETRLSRDPGDALAWAAKSQALAALMRFGEAGAAAQKSLERKGDLADGLLARGLARAGTAIQQRNLGSLRGASGAMDDFRAAAQADPGLASAWMSLGLAYEQLPGLFGGSTKKALACADNLRKVNPARGDLLQGMVLSMDGRWNDARGYFLRALSTAPGDPEVVYGYLDALGSRSTRKTLGESAQRAQCAAEAMRLLPTVKGRARGIQAVCDALLDGGVPESSWKTAHDSLHHCDLPSLMKVQLGKIAARAGIHREEGLAYLDQALKEPLEGGIGGIASVQWRRGQILKDLNRHDEARQAAQAALKADPKHPGAKRLMEDLR
ncbi:MAG: tetratricopeptide repeat protein [Holophagaceae bacterium]|nr:tetratricopeptide repeat protein [Holophagaceae bacterium]